MRFMFNYPSLIRSTFFFFSCTFTSVNSDVRKHVLFVFLVSVG